MSTAPRLIAALLFLVSFANAERVRLEYWDKWTGFEARAMEEAVAAFNASQDRVEVRYSAVSQIDLKLMLAIAGRRPPDVAGLWSFNLPAYVENNALSPLGSAATAAGLAGADYLPSIWALCNYRDRLWALPSTPSSLALHWNKRLFREAGLDPEKPPATIAELEAMNVLLTLPDERGGYRQFGHLAEEPGWWRAMWVYWFGGELWDGGDRLVVDSAAGQRAFAWVASYGERFGARQTGAFLEGFGNFSSPLNPFIRGRVAMELQGPWMWNFIQKYGDGVFELGVAPFPAEQAGGPPVTLVETDILVVPAGATHPREAFEFIRFLNRPEIIERVCAGQGKFSPLVEVSPDFWSTHPHPFIRVFYDLAASPGARAAPQITIWKELKNELDQAAKEVWAGRVTPEEALARVQARMQPGLAAAGRRWTRLEPKLTGPWEEAAETLRSP